MHPHIKQHAFTPILRRPAAILPAPIMMGAQDKNLSMHPPRQTPSSYFTPTHAFHRRAQKSFRSHSEWRWAALHVGIAWRIYHNKQRLKKMHQKPKDQLPECPTSRLPDSLQRSCNHLCIASAHRVSAYGSCGDRNEIGKRDTNVPENRSKPFELHPSSPVSCDNCTASTEEPNLGKLDHPLKQIWKKKHLSSQTDIKDLPSQEKSWDANRIPELDGRFAGSHGRKRQLERDSFIQVKRVKWETEVKQRDSLTTLHSDPSSLITPDATPFSHTGPKMNVNSLCASYPNDCRCVISYPGTELYPYQNASWEHVWNNTMDVHIRPKVLKDYIWNSFHDSITPPLYFPLALRQEARVDPRRRETHPLVL